jgi:hypothetical protein
MAEQAQQALREVGVVGDGPGVSPSPGTINPLPARSRAMLVKLFVQQLRASGKTVSP